MSGRTKASIALFAAIILTVFLLGLFVVAMNAHTSTTAGYHYSWKLHR